MSSELEKNQKYCDVIGSKVKLITKPVAMKLIKSEDEIPEGFNLIDEKVRQYGSEETKSKLEAYNNAKNKKLPEKGNFCFTYIRLRIHPS